MISIRRRTGSHKQLYAHPSLIVSVLVEIQHGDNARFGFIRENYSTFITESLDVSDQRTRRNQVGALTNARRSQLQTFEGFDFKAIGYNN